MGGGLLDFGVFACLSYLVDSGVAFGLVVSVFAWGWADRAFLNCPWSIEDDFFAWGIVLKGCHFALCISTYLPTKNLL